MLPKTFLADSLQVNTVPVTNQKTRRFWNVQNCPVYKERLITKRELTTLVYSFEKRGIVDPNVYAGWILQLYVKGIVYKEFVKKEVMEFVNSK
jgi:hypothetical protein